jgi:hypothetical protein
MIPKIADFSRNKRASLEGLEPPTRCLEGSWASPINTLG